MNNNNAKKIVNEPVYRSLSSMMKQTTTSSVDVVARDSIASLPSITSIVDNKNIVNYSKGGITTTSTTINTQAKNSFHVSRLVVNDFPLPFDMYPLSQTSVVVKDESKLDDTINNVCSCLAGSIDYCSGRINATLSSNTNITVTILRNSSNGKIYLEFNRVDGCAFVFRHAYFKSIHDSSVYLDLDIEDVKSKLKQAEMKLNMWNGTTLSTGTLLPLAPLSLKPKPLVSLST